LWRNRKPFCAISLAACERAKRKASAALLPLLLLLLLLLLLPLLALLVLLLVARNKTCCKSLSPLAVGLAATACVKPFTVLIPAAAEILARIGKSIPGT